MRQYAMRHGSRVVIITVDHSKVTARLYLNQGETASLQCWKGKTTKGAETWARCVLHP